MDSYLDKGKKRRTLAAESSPSKDETDPSSSDCDADIEAVEAALPVKTANSDDPPARLPSATVLSSNITRLNVAELGSRTHPIILEPPSPPKRRRPSYADAVHLAFVE